MSANLFYNVVCSSSRAYKTIEDEDLKFPLIYGEGKKVGTGPSLEWEEASVTSWAWLCVVWSCLSAPLSALGFCSRDNFEQHRIHHSSGHLSWGSRECGRILGGVWVSSQFCENGTPFPAHLRHSLQVSTQPLPHSSSYFIT